MYTQIKIKKEYRDKLAKLAESHNRSMANMVEVLIDGALIGTDLHPTTAARITGSVANPPFGSSTANPPFPPSTANNTYRLGKADPSIKVNNSDEPVVEPVYE